jgi:hypothetical protein
VVNKYIERRTRWQEGQGHPLSGDDVREGLVAVLSVKVREPQFEGQTKTKLGNSEAEGAVRSVVNELLAQYLDEHPKVANAIIEKAVSAARAREAARKARDLTRKKSALDVGCRASWPTARSRPARSARSTSSRATRPAARPSRGATAQFQAILPLRGKIINVEKARIDKVLSNEEIRTIITAIGSGIKDEFDLDEARYHKIVIMTDADVDGAHIRTLLLTFFFRQMPELIEAGYIYIAQPPLYRVAKGKEEYYAYDEKERDGVRPTGSRAATAREEGERQHPALQGARRDEPRAALGDHDGPGDAHLPAGDDGRRGAGRPDLLDAHGRQRRPAARVHRGERALRVEPGRTAGLPPLRRGAAEPRPAVRRLRRVFPHAYTVFLVLLACYAYFIPRSGPADWVASSRAALTFALVERGSVEHRRASREHG